MINLWLSFLAGVFAPLGAVCVLPMYPGFLAYLSGQSRKHPIWQLSLWVVAGVLSSMFLFGLIVVVFLQAALSKAIGIIGPVTFTLLGLMSIAMIFDRQLPLPKITGPRAKNPILGAFLFGSLFGFIALPCNPASLTVLFALSTTTLGFVNNFLNFVVYGIGMSLPLFLIAVLASGKKIISFFTAYARVINLIAGIIMLIISVYYLFFVF